MRNGNLTDAEYTHMRSCIVEFGEKMHDKYIAGQQQHGGNLWLKPLTSEILEEVVDLAHYVTTKRQQEEVLRTLVEAALASEDVGIKDAALNRVRELL